MLKYEISEDEFPSIKQALELVFKEEDYDSIVNVNQEILPQSPDDVYLNQYLNFQVKCNDDNEFLIVV